MWFKVLRDWIGSSQHLGDASESACLSRLVQMKERQSQSGWNNLQTFRVQSRAATRPGNRKAISHWFIEQFDCADLQARLAANQLTSCQATVSVSDAQSKLNELLMTGGNHYNGI